MDSLTTTSPTTTSAVATSAPATTSIADAIAALLEGKVVSVIGRITEVDDRPIHICTSVGKIIPIYHVVMTDKSGSVQATMWDRTADFKNFRLGDVVELQNVTVKPCREAFQEYGTVAINFGRASRIGPALKHAAQDDFTKYPRASIRFQRTTPSPSVRTPSTTNTPVKRPRNEGEQCQWGCYTPSKPFCAVNGKPHTARCDFCGEQLATRPFCPDTGLPHV